MINKLSTIFLTDVSICRHSATKPGPFHSKALMLSFFETIRMAGSNGLKGYSLGDNRCMLIVHSALDVIVGAD